MEEYCWGYLRRYAWHWRELGVLASCCCRTRSKSTPSVGHRRQVTRHVKTHHLAWPYASSSLSSVFVLLSIFSPPGQLQLTRTPQDFRFSTTSHPRIVTFIEYQLHCVFLWQTFILYILHHYSRTRLSPSRRYQLPSALLLLDTFIPLFSPAIRPFSTTRVASSTSGPA